MPDPLTGELASLAKRLGAAAVGVASADPFERELEALRVNLSSGRSGPLHFTYTDPVRATDVTKSFPWAQRIVVVGWNYLADSLAPGEVGARVGRFATADHYRKLKAVATSLADHLSQLGFRTEILMDDNRLVDRAAATRAGTGWQGKSTMVLAPGHGPWMLVGSVVTDAPLELTSPMRRDCGKCVACYPACPTGALSDEGLDARRCLSTWLQSRGSIPHWVRPLLGKRIYGCDDCLTSCPPGSQALRNAPIGTLDLAFDQLLAISDDDLLNGFRWWYVPMRNGKYLRRNLLIAAGNSGEAGARAQIEAHLDHPSSMIRGVAAWGLARAAGSGAIARIETRLDSETAPEARRELLLAHMMVSDPSRYDDLIRGEESDTAGPARRNPGPSVWRSEHLEIRRPPAG